MEEFIPIALAVADLPTDNFTVEPLGRQAVNATYMIRFPSDDRYIVRLYRWPFDGSDELDRPTKEAWLADVLQHHGIPAARVLARVETPAGTTVVLTYLPGVPLGDLPEMYDDAWFSVGHALARVHGMQVSDGRAGVISGRRVRPFPEGSWGCWQLANAVAHCDRIVSRDEYQLDAGRVRAIFQKAVPLLDSRPVRLLHNDPHPWNVIVEQGNSGWTCTGWLDWEFAWAGDPAWDLARLDIFRSIDIGPTPASFYSGYGSGPAPVVSELYELAILLWMSNEAATGDQQLLPTYQRAHHYLQQAPVVLTHLEDLLN